jgi:queuosine precursor transporter
MNEIFFALHIIIVSILVLGALKLGKQALTLAFCFQALIANLLIFKQMSFFGFVITCTDAYIIGCYFSLGLIQHYYGEKAANKAVSLCLYLLISFLIVSMMHLLYQPSEYDTYHDLYKKLLKTTPRIILTSLLVGFTSQKFNIYLQNFLGKKFLTLPRSLKIAIPIVCSQLLDTVAFSLLALYGLVHSLSSIILMSYLIKLLTILCMTPFIALSKQFIPAEKP